MLTTQALYQTAGDADIPIIIADIPENSSMCLQTQERCYICMDYGVLEDEASRRVHLSHELGHCLTGAFYNRWAARDLRQRHEHRADKWAISRLIPPDDLAHALAEGYMELWSLAEYFDVTEAFIKKALCLYTHGNLDVVYL